MFGDVGVCRDWWECDSDDGLNAETKPASVVTRIKIKTGIFMYVWNIFEGFNIPYSGKLWQGF